MTQGQPAELGHGGLRGGAPAAAEETALIYRELTMMEVKEVLRRLAAGQGLRDIARQTGVDRKTVRRYADAAKGGELTLETVQDDALVHAIIASVQGRELPPTERAARAVVAQRARIEGWLQGRPPFERRQLFLQSRIA